MTAHLVMPCKTVGEVCENLDSRRVPVKSSNRRPGPFPYYGAQGIVDYVDDYIFDGYYVLVAEDGENLRSRKENIAFIANGRFWVNNHAHILKGQDDLDTRFVFYALNFVDVSGYITGSTIPKLSQRALNSIRIPFPEKICRDESVSLLGALDDKIELNRRTNETLEVLARAIFRDWFVDFGPTRAKAEGREPYLAPELWDLFPDRLDAEGKPEGWKPRRVDQLMELAYGKSLPAKKRLPGPYRVYGSGGLAGHHSSALTHEPTIIVGRKGTVGSLLWDYEPCFPIDTVFFVKPRVPLSFCYYLLETLRLDGMNTDAAVPGLNRNNVYRLTAPWPGEAAVQMFAELAEMFHGKIRRNATESRTLTQTRDLLLPKLMSGEIRLKDAGKMAEALL
jgi:type I restriction enzyme S subunit